MIRVQRCNIAKCSNKDWAPTIVLMMTNMIRADTLCVGPSNSEFTIFTMHQFREDGFNLIGIVWICCQEIEEVQPGMTHWAMLHFIQKTLEARMIMTYGLGLQQGDGLKSQSDRIGRFLTFFLIISLAVSSNYPTVLPEFVEYSTEKRDFQLDDHYIFLTFCLLRVVLLFLSMLPGMPAVCLIFE